MNRYMNLEELLRKYFLYKERIAFLENHLAAYTPEMHEDFIEYKMFSHGYTGAAPKFVLEKGIEVAELNKVEATACEYRETCEKQFDEAKEELREELKGLRYCVAVVEDGMEILGGVNIKYRTAVERYFVNGERMENVACTLGLSGSGCYRLCKEGLKLLGKIVYGSP